MLSTRASVSLPFSWTDFLAVDKIGHAVAYGSLTLAVLWGIWKEQNLSTPKVSNWVVIVCSTYGIMLEIVQFTFFPNRYFEVLDILANIIGSLIGLFIFRKFFHT